MSIDRGVPVCYVDSSEPGWRVLVAECTATSFTPIETRRYSLCSLTGRWLNALGEKNRWCFYPVGQGECS